MRLRPASQTIMQVGKITEPNPRLSCSEIPCTAVRNQLKRVFHKVKPCRDGVRNGKDLRSVAFHLTIAMGILEEIFDATEEG